MISGLIKTSLKQFQDEHGKVMHMLRSTDPHFENFGEIYFSWIFPHKIKAWHKHLRSTMNYVVPVGSIKLVLYDDRSDSASFGEVNEFLIGEDNYHLLTIPHGIWYGFKAVENQAAMIANCATLPHDPLESIRISEKDPKIPYSWFSEHV